MKIINGLGYLIRKIKGEAKPYIIAGLEIGAIEGAIIIMSKGNGFHSLNVKQAIELINALDNFISEEPNKKETE